MRHPQPTIPSICTGTSPGTPSHTPAAPAGVAPGTEVVNQPATAQEAPPHDALPVDLVVRTARTRFFASDPEELARQAENTHDGQPRSAENHSLQDPQEQSAAGETQTLGREPGLPKSPSTPESLSTPESPSSPINLGVLIDGALADLTPAPKDSPPPVRHRGLNFIPFKPANSSLPAPGQSHLPQPALSPEGCTRAEEELAASLTGLGALDPLLSIPNITDIFVVPADPGTGTTAPGIWYEADGTLHRSDITLGGEEQVRALATRLILAAGGRLDDAYPCADAQTPGGLRVHAVLPPLSRGGTTLSIRVQSTSRPTLTDLAARGMMGQEVTALLKHIVDSRANFLISGGTGTGKTTLLGALLDEAASTDRLVLVEDTAELRPRHRHTVSLQARTPNAEGRGGVSLTDLIRAALRMRPTRLVVGECRGAEIADMLTAMNTGHSGTGGTLHANSAGAVPARLYALGALAGLSERALTLQAATALDYVVHIEREGARRLVREVARLTEQAGRLEVEPLCRVERGRRGDCLTWFPQGLELYERISATGAEGQE